MKRLAHILGITAAVLLLLLAAATLWLRSEAALHFAVTELVGRSGGTLKVGAEDGTLMGPFILKDVEFDTKGVDVHIATLTLDWNPYAQLAGVMDVRSVVIEGAELHLLPTPVRNGPLFPLHPPVMPRLPVRVVLQQVRIQDAVLYGKAGAALLQVDSAAFAARIDNRAIALRSLKVAGPGVELQGQVELATRDDYRTRADLSWRWRPPSVAELSGRTRLTGDAKQLDLDQRLDAPYALELKAQLQDAFTAPRWSGELAVAQLSTAVIRPGAGAYTAGASLRFQGDLSGTRVKGSLQADSPRLGPLDARVDLKLTPQQLDFNTLSLRLAKGGTSADLQGTVRLVAGAPATLSGSWRHAAWPGYPWLDSPAGRLQLDTDAARAHLVLTGQLAPRGNISAHLDVARTEPHAWTLSAAAQDIAPQLPLPASWMQPLSPTGDWRLAAHGDTERIHLDRLSGTWLDGSLSAQAAYTRHDGRWQARVNVQGVDPGELSDDWPGTLGAVISATGGTGSGQALHLKLDSVQGTLRDNKFVASGDLQLLGRKLTQLTADAALGDNSLHLSAGESGGDKLDWRLDAADLSEAWPDAGGSLHSTGSLDVGKSATTLQLVADGKSLAWHRDQLDTLHAEAHVNSSADAHAALSVRGLVLAGRHITSLDAGADGALEKHAVKLALASEDGDLTLTGSGDYADGHWHGLLDQVALTPSGAGAWQAPLPWSLGIAAHSVSLAAACLTQDEARACGGFDWQGGTWHGHAELDHLPLTALQTALPSGLTYAGDLHAALDANGGKAGTHFDLDAELSPGSVQNLVQGKPVTLMAYSSGKAYLHVTPALTSAGVNWQLTDGGDLDVAADVQRGPHPQLSGHVRGRFDDFQLLPAMIPQVSSASGKLTLDVGLAGTPEDPQFSGGVAFDGGDITVPLLGVHMQDVSLHLDGDAAELRLAGGARSGSGTLALSATGRRQGNVWQADGSLKGDSFRVVDIPEAQVDVSPDLGFKLDDRDVVVTGSVTIPSAHLRPRNLTSTAQVSPDQVLVGEEGGLPQEKWHLHASIRAILGAQVDFQGFGLSGDIGGQVLAVDEPGHITTGSGELTINNGLYSAFGQQLQIDDGRLLFNGGPIADPALNIRALRKSVHPEMLQPGTVEQKVGVVVRGTLRKPIVTLFSDPPLTQAQATNYLLFGSTGLETAATTTGSLPTNSAAGGQGTDLPDFSAQLGGGNGSFDVSKQNVQNAGSVQTAALFIGKYLSPRLYVSYGVGLYDPITVKRLIYKLSEKWTLQAESGAANSADIIYTLEH